MHLGGMNSSTVLKHRRVLIAAIAGALAVVVLAGIGIYGLIRGPHPSNKLSFCFNLFYTIAYAGYNW